MLSLPRSRSLLAAAAIVATVATAGSLTYSLGLGLTPCELCWYQRILMYPLVAVLAYAYYTADTGIYRLVLPFCVGGAALAAYQSYLQVVAGGTCTFGGCAAVYIRPVTIPNQSLIAFCLIGLCTLGLAVRTRRDRT
ncbi:disulfide bond formation protein BdbC, competence-related [Halarchaeum acidiphilum MH1-52-1]|uniref:Disulfide bond formation protein BdbC, competence-related n=1 Tax=Halarchaeum acidiphilum MH1-52-1 TaxID=1261545 RepID=U3A1W0_9EURY|nr:disulfide bond formation protein B [Halarchaeum acidiphilum]GAD51644.1 disulfide bond formation protein BdbC, competence-related [Halarchaeum acidiphilum MH1-52-1]